MNIKNRLDKLSKRHKKILISHLGISFISLTILIFSIFISYNLYNSPGPLVDKLIMGSIIVNSFFSLFLTLIFSINIYYFPKESSFLFRIKQLKSGDKRKAIFYLFIGTLSTFTLINSIYILIMLSLADPEMILLKLILLSIIYVSIATFWIFLGLGYGLISTSEYVMFQEFKKGVSQEQSLMNNDDLTFEQIHLKTKKGETLEKYILEHPNNVDLKYLLAAYYFQNDKLEKAEDLYLNLIKIKPHIPCLWHDLSHLYFKKREEEKALDAITKFIDTNSTSAIQWSDIARLSFNLKQFPLTKMTCENALTFNPKNEEILEYLLQIFLENKDYNNIIRVCNKLLSMGVRTLMKNFDKWIDLGNAYFIKKEYDKALEAYKRYLKYDRNNLSVWCVIAATYLKLKDYYTPKKILKNVVNLNPNSYFGWNGLGVVYHEYKKYDKALECYKKAMELNSDIAKTYSNAALTFIEKGMYDKAIKLCNKSLARDEENLYAYVPLGLAYHKKGETAKGIEYLEKANKFLPDYPRASYSLATILLDLGQIEDALEACENSLSIDPDYEDAEELLENLIKIKRDSDKKK